MDLFGDDQNVEVIRLLGKLKDTGPEYPPRLFNARRTAVLAAFAALPVGGAIALSGFARLVKIIKAMGFIDKIILATELVAVTGLGGYGAVQAYVHRAELRHLLFPNAVENTPFPTLAVPSPVPEAEMTPSETPVPSVTATPFYTVTPFTFSTPVPPKIPGGGGGGAGGGGGGQVEPTRTHGLHLGQTKTPGP